MALAAQYLRIIAEFNRIVHGTTSLLSYHLESVVLGLAGLACLAFAASPLYIGDRSTDVCLVSSLVGGPAAVILLLASLQTYVRRELDTRALVQRIEHEGFPPPLIARSRIDSSFRRELEVASERARRQTELETALAEYESVSQDRN